MLEQKIEALTAAVQQLTDVLTAGGKSVNMPAESVKPKAAIAASGAAAPKVGLACPAAPATKPTVAAKPAAKGVAKSNPAEEAANAYAEVKAATVAFVKAKGGKEHLAEIYADFGITNSAQELTPDQYPEYLERLEAEMVA